MNILRKYKALPATAVMAGFMATAPAQAVTISSQEIFGEKFTVALVEMVLSFSRFAVDLTYDSAYFDRVGQQVNITNLHIVTPEGPIDIRELGLATVDSRISISGLKVALDSGLVPPEAAMMIQGAGFETIELDALIDYRYIPSTSGLDAVIHVAGPGLGSVDIAGSVSNLHLMMEPGDDLERALENGQFDGLIRSLSFTYSDAGLAPKVIAMFGEMNGMPADQVVPMLSGMAAGGPTQGLMMITGGNPPENLKAVADKAGADAVAFLNNPGTISVSINPADPIRISAIEGLSEDPVAALTALNPSTSLGVPGQSSVAAAAALVGSSDPDAQLDLALRYLNGNGVPQSAAKALAILGADGAPAGAEADLAYAKALMISGQEDPGHENALKFALLGAAGGASGGAAFVTEVERMASAETVMKAQDDALALWREGDGGAALAETEAKAKSGDVAAMRNLASAFMGGSGPTRNYVQAYGWAAIAAAAGDPIARHVRDRIAQAATGGVIGTAILTTGQDTAAAWWDSGIGAALAAN